LIYLKNRRDYDIDWEILLDEVIIEVKRLLDISVVIVSAECAS